jgi:galactokinase
MDGAGRLPPPLADRVRHVLEENVRVVEAVGALGSGDVAKLARLLDASHESLRDLYEVSTPPVEATRQRLLQSGALGARLVGGGFGGNVLGLMPPGVEDRADVREVRAATGARVTV